MFAQAMRRETHRQQTSNAGRLLLPFSWVETKLCDPVLPSSIDSQEDLEGVISLAHVQCYSDLSRPMARQLITTLDLCPMRDRY